VRGLAISDGNAIGVQYSTGDAGVIEGNFIGTNLAGTAAKGNYSHGIFTGAETNGIRIGGDLPSQRNIVSGNTTHGMRLTGDGAIVRGNIVSADRTGLLPIPNHFRGISIECTAEVGSDRLGGDPGHNLVAFNVEHGISVSSVATADVTILGNSVHTNGLLGIEFAV
jgi:hypothetical protein